MKATTAVQISFTSLVVMAVCAAAPILLARK
jgi:hypothetical protein